MTDIRDELHSKVDEVVTDKEKEDAKDARIAALEARINEPNPGPDLSPIHGAISDLSGKFDTLLELVTAGAASKKVEAETSTEQTNSGSSDEDDDEEETAPKVVTQMTTREEVDEKPPRPSHFLFRRFGR